eukprot:269096-Amphidinium_carterae.1
MASAAASTAGGLFSTAAPTSPTVAAAVDKSVERRARLYPYDSVASQMLEPYSSSFSDTMSLQEVWKGSSSGSKKTKYHSHLCADQGTDAWHIGAGISQTAAAILAAITHLKTENMKKLLDADVCAKVMSEIKDLEPHLQQLNLGKGSQNERDSGSFRAVKKRKTASTSEVQPSNEETVLKAAGAFQKWLAQESSPLRFTLFLLAGKQQFNVFTSNAIGSEDL